MRLNALQPKKKPKRLKKKFPSLITNIIISNYIYFCFKAYSYI